MNTCLITFSLDQHLSTILAFVSSTCIELCFAVKLTVPSFVQSQLVVQRQSSTKICRKERKKEQNAVFVSSIFSKTFRKLWHLVFSKDSTKMMIHQGNTECAKQGKLYSRRQICLLSSSITEITDSSKPPALNSCTAGHHCKVITWAQHWTHVLYLLEDSWGRA